MHILLDLHLPGIGGKEFVKQMHDNQIFTPVIMMSGCERCGKDLKTNIIDYIPKGYNIEIFWDRLDKALNLAEKINYLDTATTKIKSFIARQSCQ